MMNYEDIVIRGNRRLCQQDCKLLEDTCRGVNPKTIVEIGSMDGASSLLFGIIAKEIGAHLYCIEPAPKGKWYQNIKDYHLGQWVTMIKTASPWVDMSMISLPIDYLFIDGDHRTRWAIVDYHFWSKYVREKGRIAFHDYNGGAEVKEWIRRAISIILEDDQLKEIGCNGTVRPGTIVFEK